MKKIFKEYFTNPTDDYFISPRVIRVGLVAAVFIYSVFGLADKGMAPLTYKTIWMIRFLIVVPGTVLFFLLSYMKSLYKFIRLWLTMLIITGQIGIVWMIYIAKPEEFSYYEYYFGLVLVLLWAGFIFRLSVIQIIIVSASSLILYNLVAILVQKLPFYGIGTEQYAHFVSNNLVLGSSSILTAVGGIQLNKYGLRLFHQNKKLEEEKAALETEKKRAEESDRLKSAFLANMSHEIRTPMNSILGFTELLKKPNLTKIKEEKYIDVIHTKGKQLLNLMDDIIDMAKIEANDMSMVKGKTRVNSILHILEQEYNELICRNNKSENLKLIMDKPLNSEAYIFTDELRLKQVYSILLNNAIKFTEKGIVSFGYKIIENKDIIFFVKDTGIGIKEENFKLIFERFRQVDEGTNKIFEGTGLGLHIAQNLITMLGGKIWVDSVKDKGSTFYFSFPQENVQLQKISENNLLNLPDNIDWSEHTILIAEDDEFNFTYLEEALLDTKILIIRAVNGKEAIEKFTAHPETKLVLMDMKMPVINGYEATKKIKEINKDIVIIAQTAYAMKDEEKGIFDAGCDVILTKPINDKDLLITINKYLK